MWIDDTLVVDGCADHPVAASVSGTYTNAVAGSWHRVRVDHYNRGGNGLLNLTWIRPGQTSQTVPSQYLRPRYGLTTSTTVSESNGIPDKVTATKYSDNGLDPVFGLPTSTTTDPAGLNLTRTTGYETPGTGYLRRLTETAPAGTATTPAPRPTTRPTRPAWPRPAQTRRPRTAFASPRKRSTTRPVVPSPPAPTPTRGPVPPTTLVIG